MLRAERRMVSTVSRSSSNCPFKAVSKAASCTSRKRFWVDSCTGGEKQKRNNIQRQHQTQSRAPCTIERAVYQKSLTSTPSLNKASPRRRRLLQLVQLHYSGMPDQAWEKGFLMPELPAEQPWKRCLYCSGFELWEGTLAVCQARKMVLTPKAHYDRRCNSWAPNSYCKSKPDWSAEPAAEIVAGSSW